MKNIFGQRGHWSSCCMAVVLGCSVSLCSCMGGSVGRRDIPQAKPVAGSQRNSLTSEPLTVRVADPALLSSIASVLVLPPSIAESSRSDQGGISRASSALEGIANRELSLTVVGRDWISQSRERIALVKGFGRSPILQRLGQQGVDAVLKTELGSFVERKGSAVGGEPAAVSFVMSVIRTSDSKELWQASYSYEESYINENIFQLGDAVGSKRRGAGWSSADEIFEAGASSALRDLNLRREQQFLAMR